MPELVEHVGAAEGTGAQEPELASRRGEEGLIRLQEPRDRAHEACQRLAIELVLAPKGVDDLGLGLSVLVANVVGQLAVADDRPVLVLALDRPQVHACNPRGQAQLTQ